MKDAIDRLIFPVGFLFAVIVEILFAVISVILYFVYWTPTIPAIVLGTWVLWVIGAYPVEDPLDIAIDGWNAVIPWTVFNTERDQYHPVILYLLLDGEA